MESVRDHRLLADQVLETGGAVFARQHTIDGIFLGGREGVAEQAAASGRVNGFARADWRGIVDHRTAV